MAVLADHASISATTANGVPCSSSFVAVAWRRSWKRSSSSGYLISAIWSEAGLKVERFSHGRWKAFRVSRKRTVSQNASFHDTRNQIAEGLRYTSISWFVWAPTSSRIQALRRRGFLSRESLGDKASTISLTSSSPSQRRRRLAIQSDT